MFYLYFSIFCIGAAMLQSAHLRAPKGIVPTRRRVIYAVIAVLASAIEVLVGAMQIAPVYVGAMLGIPVFYLVNKSIMGMSLRLRYTFRIGLILTLLTVVPLVRMTLPLISQISE
jgi:asparagine N-glycosylation enzyme membrane subunit Stt3